jgi:hypothetical protein
MFHKLNIASDRKRGGMQPVPRWADGKNFAQHASELCSQAMPEKCFVQGFSPIATIFEHAKIERNSANLPSSALL